LFKVIETVLAGLEVHTPQIGVDQYDKAAAVLRQKGDAQTAVAVLTKNSKAPELSLISQSKG
jgi:hypothetical protein